MSNLPVLLLLSLLLLTTLNLIDVPSCEAFVITLQDIITDPPRIWRFAVHTLEDTPFGDTEPYVNIDADLSLLYTPMMPDTEIILFHHSNLNSKIGSAFKKSASSSSTATNFYQDREWCCSQELYDEGKCSDRSELYIQGVSNWTSVEDEGVVKYYIDPSSTIYYWNSFVGYRFDNLKLQTTLVQKITFSKSGIWYLLIAQCNHSHSVNVEGVIEWHNPYGYLSGVLFPFLPMYVCISCAFLVVLIVWTVYLIKYRQNLMGLQLVITGTLTVAFIENVMWSIYYINSNKTGFISEPLNMIGAILTGSKLTLIRTCILLVSLGYSITVPNLERKIKLFVIILSIVYWSSSTLQQYVWVDRTIGFEFPKLIEFTLWIIVVISNLCYFAWISISLVAQWKILSATQQSEKLGMYKKLSVFLIIFLFISIALFLTQTTLTVLNQRDELWQIWWIWDGYWEVVYLLVILLIAQLWWPNQNNERYAYSIQLQTEDNFDDESLEDVIQLNDSL